MVKHACNGSIPADTSGPVVCVNTTSSIRPDFGGEHIWVFQPVDVSGLWIAILLPCDPRSWRLGVQPVDCDDTTVVSCLCREL